VVRVAAVLVAVLLAAAAGGQASSPPAGGTPAVDGTAGLGLGSVAWLPGEAIVGEAGAPTEPAKLAYAVRLGDLIPASSSFYRESVLAAWESPLGRLEWNIWAMQGCLGQPPPCQGPPALLLGLPMGIEVGPDGRTRMVVPGPWSKDWGKLTLEEQFGIMLQEAAVLTALIALVKGL